MFVPSILEQEPGPGSTVTLSTPQVRIRFDNSANQLQKEKLLIEIDRTDVSAFVQFNEGTLIYQPTVGMTVGQHEIRVTGTSADGKPIQEIIWNFVIQEAPKNVIFALEPTGTIEYKAREDSPTPTDRHRFNSNIAIRNQTMGRLQTNFNSNLQSQNPNAGEVPYDFDLANFQAVVGYDNSTVSLGDVIVNFDLLGVANLSRRGILFQQKLPFLSSGFDVFSVRSEAIIGFRHGLGFSDSDQRVDGGSFFFSPTGKPENLNLRIYYLRGENAKEQGFNFGGVTRGSKGQAVGLYATTSTWTNQFRLEANAGWSDFDFNGSDEFDGNKDHALQLKFIFDPAPKTWKNRPSKFLTQLEIQDLGTFFKTLGNPFIVADRRGFNWNGSWNYGQVAFVGGFSNFFDNVKNIALIPRVDNRAFSAGFTYTPVSLEGLPKWPSVALTATRAEQESRTASVAFLGLHNIVDTYASLVNLTRTKWSLSWNTSYSLNKDLNNRVPDSDTLNITTAAMFMPAPFYTLGPSVSFIRQSNRDTEIDTDLWTYTFTGSIPIQPERFTLDTQLTYGATSSSDDLNLSSNFSGTAQFSYHMHNLFKLKGKQTVGVRAAYNRLIVDAPFVNRQKGLEIFVLFDLGWPFQN